MKNTQTHTAIKPAILGSISHGTLHTCDLLSTFIRELEWQVSRNGDYFCLPENFGERDGLAGIIGEAQDCFAENGDIDPEKEDAAEEMVNETLPYALQAFSPPYVYFGAHYGDGSDFGYWPNLEEIDELPTYESTDAAKEVGGENDYKVVSDHGNVEIYTAEGTSILSIV